jgi:hypothetical protein
MSPAFASHVWVEKTGVLQKFNQRHGGTIARATGGRLTSTSENQGFPELDTASDEVKSASVDIATGTAAMPQTAPVI